MLDPNQPLAAVTFVAFDTETTGTGAGTRVIEIAGARFVGDREEGTFQALIDPEQPIPPESTAVHQITDEMVRGQCNACDAMSRFFEFAQGAVLVAHNSPFDASMIGLELGRARLAAPPLLIIDSLKAARRSYPGSSHSLDTLIETAGLPRQDARHRALGDAVLVRYLVRRLTEILGGDGAPFSKLLECSGGSETLEKYLPQEPQLPFGLKLLAEAVKSQSKVNLHLDTGSAKTQQKIVSPRMLYSWYGTDVLEAFCSDEGLLRTFRLDKITRVEKGASSGFLF
jgi:DNA polymerase III epsilon subunit family exonuclease